MNANGFKDFKIVWTDKTETNDISGFNKDNFDQFIYIQDNLGSFQGNTRFTNHIDGKDEYLFHDGATSYIHYRCWSLSGTKINYNGD